MHPFVSRCSLTLVVYGILVWGSSAHASLILGNLPAANDNGITNFTVPSTRKAAVFTVGPQDVSLTDIIVRLNNYNTSAPQPDRVNLGIFSDAGAAPGAQVGGFLNAPTSATPSLGNFTFTPSGAITLLANTRYWLVMSRQTGNFQWRGSTDASTNSPLGALATFDFFRLSTDGGATYGLTPINNSFQINGIALTTAVPEPASLILTGIGICGLYFRKRLSRETRAN